MKFFLTDPLRCLKGKLVIDTEFKNNWSELTVPHFKECPMSEIFIQFPVMCTLDGLNLVSIELINFKIPVAYKKFRVKITV